MHEKCQEITEVKTLVTDMKTEIADLKGLYKPVNRLTGILVVVGIIITIFLFMVKDTKSSIDALTKQHADDIRELARLVNEDLKALAVSNAEQRIEIKQLSKDISTTNANVVWIQNRLIDKEK